jgi:small GTP-binding protein
MTRLIKGVVYIEFHDQKGTNPVLWLPNDLNEQLRVLCGIKAVSLLAGEQNYIPKSLITIPFPSRNLIGLLRFLKWNDNTRRGKIGRSSIILLFHEADDAIFYKAKNSIKEIFDETIKEIIGVEKKAADKANIEKKLYALQDQIDFIINDLKEKEISKKKVNEFPFKENNKEEDIDYKIKTIVCGEPRVGKTSIILQFTDNAFTRTYLPTLGVSISEKEVRLNGNVIKLVLWDLAGQSKFETARIHFYQGAEVILLVFDLTNEDSFKTINKWYDDIIKSYKHPKQLLGFLIGNKKDLEDQRKISQDKALELADELGFSYFETSALTGENISSMFEYIGNEKLKIIEKSNTEPSK